MVGTLGYGMEEYAGGSIHTWGVALDLLKKRKIDLKKYVTHKFPIEDYREAIKVNIYKERYRAIKTAFAF
jgi:threonine dehydrogenase-like Zn-dependent dehydrogenase